MLPRARSTHPGGIHAWPTKLWVVRVDKACPQCEDKSSPVILNDPSNLSFSTPAIDESGARIDQASRDYVIEFPGEVISAGVKIEARTGNEYWPRSVTCIAASPLLERGFAAMNSRLLDRWRMRP